MKRTYRVVVASLLLPAVILVVSLAWLLATQSGLQWAYNRAQTYLPVELTFGQLEGSISGPITVRGIEVRQNGSVFKIDQLIFDWQPAALIVADVDINRLHIQSLDIVLPDAEKTEQNASQEIILPEIHLPWRTSIKDVEVNNISVAQGDQLFKLKQIKLNASALFTKIDIEKLSVTADVYSLDINGILRPEKNYRHDLAVHWKTTLPSGAILEGEGELKGDIKTTHIKQQTHGPIQLTLQAEISDVLKQLHWQTNIDATHFDAAQVSADFPAMSGNLKLQGEGDLSTAKVTGLMVATATEVGAFDASFDLQRLSDNSVQINQLKLNSPVNNAAITAKGLWVPAENSGDTRLTLDWKNLRWPLQGDALFNSASGNGSIEGSIDQYQIKLTTDSRWADLLPSTWTASAEGNLDGMIFTSLHISALNGEADATGQLSWSPVLSWQAKATVKNVNPASLQPQWPGQLNATLTSKGRIENEQLIADVDVVQLSGVLRDYPVTLRSRVHMRDNIFDIASFDFHSGSARVSMQGKISDKLELDWSVDATDLAELYPGAQGQFQAKGHFTGPRIAPTVQATFKGNALSLPNYRIGNLDGALSIDLFQWQQLDIDVDAQMLELNDYSLQSLNISSANERIVAEVVSSKLSALIELQSKADAQGWHGLLEKVDITSQKFQDWSLKAPVAIEISKEIVKAQPLCLISDDSNICLTINRAVDRWQASLDASQMPMLLLTPWLPEELDLEGRINANARLNYSAPGTLLGQGNIELLPGTISYPILEGERDRWDYRGGTLLITLDEHGIKSNADIAMSNGDRFNFKAALPQAQLLTLDPEQQLVIADAQLSIHDLGLIEVLIPEVQDMKGVVTLKIAVAGTLAHPELSGSANLIDGELRIPRLGLTINQLSLKSQSDAFKKLNFLLNAQSGEGHLIIKGQTDLNEETGWLTEATINGENFVVSSIPEARVQVSPELKVELKNRSIDVSGKVHIPYAKLQPKDTTTASRVSDDVIIIGGEQPAEESWKIHTRIRVTLGERVNFYGFGFEGRLGGSLLLEDEPGQLTKATGEITIPEGRYRAYGQRLDVEHGRLLYTGGPLTNPGLDVRAVRRTDNVTAGLHLKGSFNQPQLELFSSPAMGQTDALAYLMLGGPIENASGEEGAMMAKAALALGLSGGDSLARTIGDRFGVDEMRVESSNSGDQASLVVGRYLSPKLYVSYGVGLVEAINTLTLRYKITDKWQLKAESGEYQGADIMYTIER